MNTNLEEQELTRWLDGEMTPAELASFEARLASNPALRSEAETMRQLCADVKAYFPVVADVPHPDFFNSQVMERISELDLADRRQEAKRSPWFAWLTRPWLALAGAAAVLLIVGHFVFTDDMDPENATTLLNTYAPDTDIEARTYHSKDANATILELDGIEEIPEESNVVGFKSPRPGAGRNMAQVFSQKGDVLTVLAMNDEATP